MHQTNLKQTPNFTNNLFSKNTEWIVKYHKSEFTTTHNLNFEVSKESKNHIRDFKIGSLYGKYTETKKQITIHFITNKNRRNGHFNDYEQWLEYIRTTHKKMIVHYMVVNARLRERYLKKGFKPSFINEKILIKLNK